MYYLNTTPGKKTSWRNAYEVQVAALEHNKRRFQNEDDMAFGKPQDTSKKTTHSTRKRIFELGSQLLALLIG